MKKFSFLLLGVMCFVSTYSQKTVVLESNGTTNVFDGTSPFVQAYETAVDGDIIYLPGGSFKPPALIDKNISIIGAGHYPSTVTGITPTVISAPLVIGENASGLFLEGMDFGNYNIEFTDDKAINDVIVSRCKFYQLLYNGTGTSKAINNTIKGCVITNEIYLTNTSGTTLSNSLVYGRIYFGSGNFIKNNIIMYERANSGSNYSPISQLSNCTISGNVFLKDYNGYIQYECQSCTFSNNIFASNPPVGNNTFENNYNSIDLSTLFVNQSGNTFNYDHDYHLSGSNASIYIGTDDTQVGIFGGLFPYKEHAIPSNPQITSKSIAASTNDNGMLNVNITVEAQDN